MYECLIKLLYFKFFNKKIHYVVINKKYYQFKFLQSIESVVEKVIIGGINEDGNKDPEQITFVYKTGFKSSLNGDKFKPQRKNARGRHRTDELCSHDNNEVEKLCSDSSSDISGDSG